MKLTILGTGNALVTEVYNTCFLLEDETRENDGYFLVDAGGGNGILKQLKRAGTNWRDVHEIFITHKHIDHFLGALWLIRMILQKSAKGEYKGETNIYGHDEVIFSSFAYVARSLERKGDRADRQNAAFRRRFRRRKPHDSRQKSHVFRYPLYKSKTVRLLHAAEKRRKIHLLRRRAV